MSYELEPLLDQARHALANFVGADVGNLVFVPNATTGVNTVLRSLTFQPGDELLTIDHAYNACRNALDFVAARSGLQVVVAPVPFPIADSEQVLEAVLDRVSAKTRLAMLDHVTSQSGLILPIQQLVQELNQRGVDTLVDGAHAPGMVPLELERLGAAYYTGNCHKWLCAPKGAAFLYVRPDRQAPIRPLTISHGANSPRTDRSRFHLEFDWTGTNDPTAYLSVPAALEFMQDLLPGGWTEVIERNHQLVLQGRKLIGEALDVPLPCPDSMISSLATIPLPAPVNPSLQTDLFDKFRIEVPIFPWTDPPRSQSVSSGESLLRLSAQLYNTPEQYTALSHALTYLI